MNKTLYLIRGLAGSGKSTLARLIAEKEYFIADNRLDGYAVKDCHMVCADDFFDVEGKYEFDASRLPDAHDWCSSQVYSKLSKGMDNVVVHNTFSQRWEMEPYFELAEEFGYSVFVIECQNDFGSIHNVPDHVREHMKKRWHTNPRDPEEPKY
tara:strand:- start:5167 stop:5625 length:459 start_codon:yes stop_codon:yes gene_type:complete